MYSLLGRDNSQQTIQMHISEKEKFLLTSFVPFPNLDQVLNIFTKDHPHSLCISEIMDSEIRG